MQEIAQGVIEHAASGMQFPLECGDFTRAEFRQYDAAGLDVSVAYNSSSPIPPIAVTAYVYPSPPLRSFGSPKSVVDDAKSTLALGEFERCKGEIAKYHPGARLTSETDFSAPSESRSPKGYLACYTYVENFGGRTGPVESLLYVYCYVGDIWTIKFRITYSAGVDARPLVDRYLKDLRWTIRGPNQPALQTPTSGTPAAASSAEVTEARGAPVAPPPGTASR
jgi:hypothetical protein